ncbi:hypothetical protein [Nocardioides coralli]|uniref:hypothetical protein n=1 Tax=Nocardioides coralli TaxID=2872154 RepID=UPI001CA3952D|nr:hypothetical protein [Nocardioides coralli]QZY29011.1 hypothetical protein K6T13_16490 [Nocardioides coralli]
MDNAHRLRSVVAVLIVANLVAAVVAVLVNWPGQFGAVRTDASDGVVLEGTAISAPLLVVVLWLLAFFLVTRRDGWAWVGVGAAGVSAVAVCIGGLGELVADGTPETPKTVLVASGIVWTVVAIVLATLVAAVVRERRRSPLPG